MAAPEERTRRYFEKHPIARWVLSVDFADRLPAEVTLAASGHSVEVHDAAGNDVTAALLDASSLEVNGTALEVTCRETAATPEVSGTFSVRFFAKTTQGDGMIEDGPEAFLLVRD